MFLHLMDVTRRTQKLASPIPFGPGRIAPSRLAGSGGSGTWNLRLPRRELPDSFGRQHLSDKKLARATVEMTLMPLLAYEDSANASAIERVISVASLQLLGTLQIGIKFDPYFAFDIAGSAGQYLPFRPCAITNGHREFLPVIFLRCLHRCAQRNVRNSGARSG